MCQGAGNHKKSKPAVLQCKSKNKEKKQANKKQMTNLPTTKTKKQTYVTFNSKQTQSKSDSPTKL